MVTELLCVRSNADFKRTENENTKTAFLMEFTPVIFLHNKQMYKPH